MPTYTDNQVHYRAGAELLDALDARADSRGEAARRDLERYYALLAMERRRMRREGTFSANELALMVDAGNGTIWEPTMEGALAANVEDAIALDGLAAKWDVDGPALIAKLHALAPLGEWAIIDAVERYWRDPEGRNVIATLLYG